MGFELSDIGDAFSDLADSIDETFISGKKVPRTNVTGVGSIGQDPENVANEYQRRLAELAAGRQRGAEGAALDQQRASILGQMGPNYAASYAARQQAQGAGQATLGAARGAGAQTAALGALGAGQSAQYGMQAAAGVRAGEEQQNALAQLQYAAMLRAQDVARLGIDRGDAASGLVAGRALLTSGLEQNEKFAANEAARAQKEFGSAVGAAGAGVAALGRQKKNPGDE